jgi:hypothetical protein
MTTTQDRRGFHPAVLIAPLLAITLAYLFYTGLFCSDDTRYLLGIQKITSGEPIDLGSIAERRLIFLLPGALAHWLSGGLNDAAIAVYSLFYVLIPVFAWLGLRKYGVACATFASVSLALAPLLYARAGALLPDVASALVLTLTMTLTMAVTTNGQSISGKRRAFMVFGMGASAMLGVAIKESNAVVAILPFAVLAVSALSRRELGGGFRDICLASSGVVCFVAAELVLYKLFSGVWHFSLMNKASDHGFLSYTETQGLYPLERFRFLISILDTWTFYTLIFGLAALSIFIMAGLRRPTRITFREWIVPAVYFVWPLLYFTIGTASFDAYVPPVMQPRYYAPCVVPAIILLSLWIFGRRQHNKGIAYTLAAAFVAFLLTGVHGSFKERGTQYWARAKDSMNLALIDVAKAGPRALVVAGHGAVNSEVGRCLRILLDESRGDGWKTMEDQGVEAPFFVLGTTPERLLGETSPLGTKTQDRISRGEWAIGIVGYYYADDEAAQKTWWLPRQEAVKYEYLLDRSRFHEQMKPSGHIPWMKREMHAELYFVYPTNSHGNWWND